jgi:ectoine hydroxylase-related dioxygenase (phytanoyl-CoA dioxygenase family)
MIQLISNLKELTAKYARDGFVRVPAFFGPELLKAVRSQLERYERNIASVVPDGDRVYESDGRSIRNLWRLEQHDPYFKKLAGRSEICSLISTLVRGTPLLMAVETFNKPPRVGSGVPPHQDNAYFCQSPPDALTVWIALDAATIENGPIYYLKGSHKAGVFPHRPSGVAGNSMGLASMPEQHKAFEFCGTLDPGDAMIHHCQTIHWSGTNKSEKSRRGLLLVYRGAHTTSDPRLKADYDAARGINA